MKARGCRLTRLETTCAPAPAIATDVASTTLPVVRYIARNTMVERKSVKSLANTSFMVGLHLERSKAISKLAHLSDRLPMALANPGDDFRQRFGPGLGNYAERPILGLSILRIPLGEIRRAVARGARDRKAGPQRQVRYINHQDVGDHHHQEGQGPDRGDDIICLPEAGEIGGFGI